MYQKYVILSLFLDTEAFEACFRYLLVMWCDGIESKQHTLAARQLADRVCRWKSMLWLSVQGG